MKYGFILLVTILLFSSCAGLKSNKKPAPAPEQNISAQEKNSPLDQALSFVQLAKEAEQIADTMGADYYYGKAMDIVGDLQKQDIQTLDSISLGTLENISLEYARYLERMNGIENDTLSAANVLQALSDMEDSLAARENDSTLVSIPDVIEDEEQLAIPLVLNQKVENAIKYFQSRGRRVFTKWLQRAGKYRNLAKEILNEEQVPEELYYLAMIESGFNPYANSYARAVGMWQFIYSTGKAYGLTSSWWYDERRDPEKSTRAAAKHLKDLYGRFNNWYLAIAGYNFSPGKIEKRIQRYNVDEFWELPRLPRQTRNYVPTFIAAALMAKSPEKYGFFVDEESPVEFDTVTVRECVDLNVVANCVGSSFDEVKKLNPALLRWCTPPDLDSWILNIPRGTRVQFLENYAKVPDDQKLTWIHHRIRSGETLSTIAQRYRVSMSEIKRFNKIRGSFIRAGQSLVIPVPQNKKYNYKYASRYTPPRSSRRSKPVANVPGREKQVHIVRQGESLWEIATRYGVTLTQIRSWNGLGYSRIIHPGQELNIWLPKTSALLADNETQGPPAPPTSTEAGTDGGNGKTIMYTVRSGDTLWDIASRYGVSIRDIKNWNNRRSNRIRPGDQLKIVVSD
ncbi:MAG: LysM peptidoglycan-binding domain-containing protein [Calditrichia bacterium]